jgi:membrane protease YdiL (CAAX protease family)
MEIYQQPGSQPNQESQSQRRQFPESNLNFRLPIWEKVVFFLLGSFGFNLIGNFLYYLFGLFISDEILSETLALFFSYLFLAGFFVLFLFFDHRKTYVTFAINFKDKKVYLYGLVGAVAVFLIEVIFNMIYKVTVPDIYGANDNQLSIVDLTQAYPILMFFPLVLFAPFTEELTYRIGLVDSIGHKDERRWVGILVSGLIFGLIHFSFQSILTYQSYLSAYQAGTANVTLADVITKKNLVLNELLNLPIYILSGITFAFLYAKTGKISSSMMAHCYNNLYSYITILLDLVVSQQATSNSSESSLVSTIASLWLH